MKIYILACSNSEYVSPTNKYYDRPVTEDMIAIDVSIPDQIRTNEKKLIGYDLEGNPLYKGGSDGYYYEKILRKAVCYGWVVDNIESFRDLIKKYELNCRQTYYLVGSPNDLVLAASGKIR